ncbi:hypothetical protein [Novosphingobium sp. Leaf2]|uniref:hypothetical protein n=1 Tax=Novosphingobium sp. Leaf2 TaxID=1735670 RepID=UPI0006F70800|nr:hypothetical protein [Novosphingobium sp. Leaf2]KQM18863.1 hypothetical protein ASE49_06965 [Novosphingobium sp. Leaf2]
MFMDFREPWPPEGETPQPPAPGPVISKRGEKVLAIIMGVNAVLLLVAPIGGVTMLQPLIHWLTK